MAKIIEVVVSPTGETTVQTKGFTGGECMNASQWLEKALGISGETHKTSEYFQSDQTQQQEVHE